MGATSCDARLKETRAREGWGCGVRLLGVGDAGMEGRTDSFLALTLPWWEKLIPGGAGRLSGPREQEGRDANNTKPRVHLSSLLPSAVSLHRALKGGYKNIMLKGLTVQTETSRSDYGS